MDKYEYRVRVEEIKRLLEKREYVEAMYVANEVDWKRVRSISMLCTVSEIYKANRQYAKSRDILLLAYERYPNGRVILYGLCELAIKMGEYVQAIEYYKELVKAAPKDTGRYILQYKIYQAQDVSMEESISVLEEFKKRDYREKWGYELAYLYHKVGLEAKCIEECNELILWFGEGKYVTKAMELKSLHEPLNVLQKNKYNKNRREAKLHHTEYTDIAKEEGHRAFKKQDEPTVEEIKVYPVNVGRYNTMNLQEELAKGMQEVMEAQENTSYDSNDETKEETAKIYQFARIKEESPQKKEKGSHYETLLTEENDGQLGLYLNTPSQKSIDKQITGQLDLSDVLAEWENIKRENDRKRIEEAKRKSLEQTNDIMSQLVGVIPGLTPIDPSSLQTDMDIPEAFPLPEEYRDKKVDGENQVQFFNEHDVSEQGINNDDEHYEVEENTDSEMYEEYVEEEEYGDEEYEEELSEEEERDREPYEEEEYVEEEEYGDEIDSKKGEESQEKWMEDEDDHTNNTDTDELIDSQEQVKEGKTKSQISRKKEERDFTDEEFEFLESYAEMENVKGQLIHALDGADLNPIFGNIIVTGSHGSGRTQLAINTVKAIQATHEEFVGKVAKIAANALNKKDVKAILSQLAGGAFVIEHAGSMKAVTAQKLVRGLREYEKTILVVLEDSKNSMDKLISTVPEINELFTQRVDIPEYSNDDLVAYGKAYALKKDCSIDEMGMLALYTKIADMQTLEHSVTIAEVKDMIDTAIKRVSKKNMKHFVDILLAKRYDEDDYIILREKDFL